MSLNERLVEAQVKMKNMANRVQIEKQLNREEGELFRHVATLKSQLHSSNTALQELDQAKNEMTVLLNISKGRNLGLEI